MLRIQVFKTHPLEPRKWSNVYLVDTDTLATGVAALALIYAAESEFHNIATTFVSGLVSTITEGDEVFQSVPLNSPGERTDPADNLPLWNTLRVDFPVVGGGRPSRKYYRLPLGESDVNNYVVQSGVISLVEGVLTSLIADLSSLGAAWVDPDAQEIESAQAVARVQMRQLHRKRRRSPPA